MKYVAYYRVSTKKQGDSGLGLEAQQITVRAFHPVLEKEFTEVKSGKNIYERPKLKEAIEYCKSTGATLVVAKVDRLSRNLEDGRYVLRELPGQIEFCDIPGQVDEFTINLFLLFGERERLLISLRNKAAAVAKKARGGKMGNPHKFTNEGRLLGAQAQARAARESEQVIKAKAYASALKSDGYSYDGIAHLLNDSTFTTRTGGKWSEGSVWGLLNRK